MVEAIYYVEDSERYFPQNCGIIIKNNNGKRSFTFYDEEEFAELLQRYGSMRHVQTVGNER